MRTILFAAMMLLGSAPAAPPPAHDPVAVAILDRMADNIGSLHSCTVRLQTARDEWDADAGVTVTRHDRHEVMLAGPDKMLVNSNGDHGHRGYWYDGAYLVYYSYDENNYGRVDAPPTIIEAIDSVHNDYGIDFPAADFIYPTFVTDLLAQSSRVAYLGTVEVAGRRCFHVVATGAAQDVELWIADDAANLPAKYRFRDKDRANSRTTTYEGVFEDWQLNPDLPEGVFSFMPPPGATPVRMLSRQEQPNGGAR
jgi:hypothetical protein